MESFDLTVLGSGPGGYVAAIRAAQLGMKVAIVERDALGGVCLNWGCIPTKALLKIAENYEFLKSSASWGFQVGEVAVDWPRVIERSREAAGRLNKGVTHLMKKRASMQVELDKYYDTIPATDKFDEETGIKVPGEAVARPKDGEDTKKLSKSERKKTCRIAWRKLGVILNSSFKEYSFLFLSGVKEIVGDSSIAMPVK